MHLARRHVQPSNAVGLLGGEPDVPLAIKDERVRVTRLARHEDLGFSRGGVQASYPSVAVAGVPHLAFRVDDGVVRICALLDLVLPHAFGRRIEVRDVVPRLAHEPHFAVRGYIGVSASSAPLSIPLLESGLGGRCSGRSGDVLGHYNGGPYACAGECKEGVSGYPSHRSRPRAGGRGQFVESCRHHLTDCTARTPAPPARRRHEATWLTPGTIGQRCDTACLLGSSSPGHQVE